MADEPKETIQNNAPWWDQTIMKVGSTFGVPTLLLGYYLAQDAGLIKNPVVETMQALKTEMQELKGVVVQQGLSMKNMSEQMAKDSENRQMRCVLRAKTEDEKKACFPSVKD